MEEILQTQMLMLLRGALNEQMLTVDTPPDIPQLAKEAARHGIENMLFFGVRAAGVDKNDPQMKTLLHTVGRHIFITENQIAEANAVCAAFDKAGIAYLPVKGMVLRELYPSADMRTMGDVDILIREQQIPQIKELLTSLGFTFVLESVHEYVWEKKGVLYLELHKSLFAEYETDVFPVFGSGWELAIAPESGCHYTLSPEDHFLYVFVHFAKHYRGGGIGLRHLSDIVICLRNGGIKNWQYVEQQLQRVQMLEFYKNVRAAIDEWLGDGPLSEKSAFILRQIWTSGVYGTPEAHRTADAERATTGSLKMAKANRIQKLLFPSRLDMALQYPVLKKVPVLLPFFWVVRFVRVALFRPGQAVSRSKGLHDVSVEDIRDRQQALRYVGLSPMADRHK